MTQKHTPAHFRYVHYMRSFPDPAICTKNTAYMLDRLHFVLALGASHLLTKRVHLDANNPQGKTAAAKSLVILEREPRPTLARQAGAVDEAGALLASPLKLMILRLIGLKALTDLGIQIADTGVCPHSRQGITAE